MAVKEINLLGEKQALTPEIQRARQTLKTGTTWMLIIYFLLVTVLFISSFYISNQLEATDRAITSERARIKALEKNEGAYVLLKRKASSLVQILTSRYPYTDLVEYLKQIGGQDNYVRALRLRETGGSEIDINAANSEGLDGFISSLLDKSDQRFARIELRSLRTTTEGGYEATLYLATNQKVEGDLPTN